MRKNVLLQLESLGFRKIPSSRLSLRYLSAGLFVTQNGQEHILLYPKLFSAPWPHWVAALRQSQQKYILIRLSDKRVLIQIAAQQNPEQYLSELTNLVRDSSRKAIFTPELGFSHADTSSKSSRFLAPAISLTTALGFLLVFVSNNHPTDNATVGRTQEAQMKERCLAELEIPEMQKETIGLLSEMQLPAYSEGSLNLETDFGILEITPEQTIGGMTLISVKISCFENDSTKLMKFRSDVNAKGELRLVESN